MPQPDNIFEVFEAQAGKTPKATAVIEGEGIVTSYRDLLQHANRVSAYLQASGISAEEPVGVIMSRTSQMVGVLLGILKSGASFVSISPEDPAGRQRRYIAQAGIRKLLADHTYKQRAEQLSMTAGNAEPHFEVIGTEMIITKQWPGNDTPQVHSSGLAYIMFTSGSTGDPKGVEVEHRNMLTVLQTTADMLKVSADDCFLAASSLSFDLSISDIFLPLIRGGRLLLRDKKCWTDIAQLARDIRLYGVTVVETPPSLWSLVLGAEVPFPKVRIAITCGEATQIPLAKQLVGICDEAWNFYGPTESTVWCTAYHITPQGLMEDKHSDVSISIGRQIDCAQVRIVDDQGRIETQGQKGELWVTGAGLSRGYRNDATLTASKFVCPEGEKVRYYRTGDLVSQDDDGNLRYFGRIDDQLQIHGRRIEPGDIESSVRLHHAVQDVAATWYNTKTGTRSIVVMVIRKNDTLTVFELHKWLSEQLPKGMLPSHYVFAESIPLLTSGKVDRHAIRSAVAAKEDPAGTVLRNLTTTEEFVMDAWRHVLKTDTINPTDHFFTIGGDSLSAVILMTRLEAALNVQLPDEFVYENYTLEKMALRLDHIRVRSGQVKAQVRKRSMYERVGCIIKRHILKKTTRKQRSLSEILELQRLYVNVWRGHKTSPEALIVTLNPDGKERHLFWCMQAYWELAEMAKVMPDHPIHGMRSGPGVVHRHFEKELEALAAHYAEEIHGIQPEGALILGGNCFGAQIMQYVAEHLRLIGREIEILVLLEHQVTRKYTGHVHLIYGRESSSNPFVDNRTTVDRKYKQLLPDGYALDIVPGKYAELFRPVNIQEVVEILQSILAGVHIGAEV